MIQALGYIAAFVGLYFCVGSATVLATSYIQQRITGKAWFNKHHTQYDSGRGTVNKRWWSAQDNPSLPCPGTVFLGWPLYIPIVGMCFVVSGFFKATEGIGDRFIAVADEQRKRIGTFRENPK